MTVRPATLADARQIAAVHVASWRAGYRGVVPPVVLAELDVEERAARWREWLGTASALVCGDPIAGFAGYRAGEGEIAALYVAPERWRRRVGSALLVATHAELRAAGRDRAHLWVFAANERARAFYAAHGYAPDGGRDIHPRTGLELVRLASALA